MKLTNHKKLVLTSSCLIACLGLSIMANHISLGEKNEVNVASNSKSGHSLRGPASQITAPLRSGSFTIERQFASKIAQSKSRSPASIGRPADLFENLKFGVLEGKYALKMEGDKISEIKFVDNPNSEGSPAQIKNRLDFLKTYGSLLDGQSEPSRISINVNGKMTTETYRLKSNQSDKDTIVSIILDDYDRLFEVHSEKATALKIF